VVNLPGIFIHLCKKIVPPLLLLIHSLLLRLRQALDLPYSKPVVLQRMSGSFFIFG
jgi:hypothetical protein